MKPPPAPVTKTRFVRKFQGPNARLNIRLDVPRKRKLDAHARAIGIEVSDLVRGWLHPLIDALPDEVEG